jgi:nicotinamide mononucleotide (NMN) deamidase PncC
METPTKTTFQVLHLERLSTLFGVDVTPAESLSGGDLEAWMTQVEDQLFDGSWSHE